MTDFPRSSPQQYIDNDHFHENSSPGVSWSAAGFISCQHPQSAPSSNPHPLQGQIWGHAGVDMDAPAQAPVPRPAPENVNFEVLQGAAGPAPAFLDEVPHGDPLPNGRASEVLRQLALRYLNDPNAQLTMVRMGPGHSNEVSVDITLKLTNL